MSTLVFILLVAVNGLLIGALARLALPGPDPMSIPQTMLIGVVGSLAGGLIAYYAFGESEAAGLLLALVVTVGLVYGARRLRHAGPRPPVSGMQADER